MERNELIELKGIVKRFDDETILKSLDLSIKDGEFVTLLGPSGCGKTTTLRIIAGFETPDEGEVLFAGKNINKVPPNKRNINTVFQRFNSLYETPFGAVPMEVLTYKIVNDLEPDEGKGKLFIDYEISLKGLAESRSMLDIEVTPTMN